MIQSFAKIHILQKKCDKTRIILCKTQHIYHKQVRQETMPGTRVYVEYY